MKVAVIGAGISGLTAALRLQASGHQVQVLEADSHPGGRMWTRSVFCSRADPRASTDGFPVDVGAHMLLDCFERTRALVDEVGLGDSWFEVVAGAGGGVLHDHELASFSPKNAFDVLRYRGLSLRGRFRVLLTFLRAARHDRDLDFFDLSVGDDALDHEDCEAFARRNLGDEATDYIVDCFIRTFHFHGARKMSAKYLEALLGLLISQHGFEVCALRGHMKALPEAIAARLPVHYGVEVSQVAPLSEGVEVVSARGSQRYDAVVLATPAEVARALLRAPTSRQREVLAHACSSRTALCVFRVPTDVAGTFEGVWVPFVESKLVSGLANDACLGTKRGAWTLFSVWLHEEAAEELWERTDEALLSLVMEELIRLFPHYRGQLEPMHVERWSHALPVYGVGQVSRVRAFWERGQGEGGIWLCGDYLNHPWLEGAVRCGEKVAMRLHTRALTRLIPSIAASALEE